MRVYIIGYMCSGKTHFAEQLAHAMHYDFCDMDNLFEQQTGQSVFSFFGQYGEEKFRIIEQGILQQTTSLQNTIISTGGGTPCFFNNMEQMLQNGFCIFLDTPENIILQRMQKSNLTRPLVANKSIDELPSFINTQLSLRKSYYQQAHLCINPLQTTLLETVETILQNKKPNSS